MDHEKDTRLLNLKLALGIFKGGKFPLKKFADLFESRELAVQPLPPGVGGAVEESGWPGGGVVGSWVIKSVEATRRL